MFTLIVTEKGGSPKRMDFDKDEITIGRVPGNDVILPKGNVSKRHTRVVRQDGRFFVVDLKSTNGTYLNGRRITTPSVIRPGDKIYVGDFVVMVEASDGAAPVASEDLDGDEGTTNLRAEQAQAAMRDVGPPSVHPEPNRPEVSAVEPLPLDEEPPESSPPPPRPMAPAQRASLATPGASSPLGPPPMSPSRPMMTQPLGSASAAAMNTAAMQPPPAGAGSPNRPTQPPPRANPLRAPSVPGLARAPLPGARPPGGMGAPPMSTSPGPGAQRPSVPPMSPSEGRRPSSGAMPASNAMPPLSAQMPPPVATPVSNETMDAEPESDEPISTVMGSGNAGFAPPASPVFPAEAQSEPPPAMSATSTAVASSPPAMAPVMAAAPPMAPAMAVAAPSPPVPPASSAPASAQSAATLNIAPSVVDAVIQAHRAATPSAAGEPVPVGREYATLLAEIVAEAAPKAPNVASDRVAESGVRAQIRSAVESAARERSNLPNGVTAERLTRDATAEIAGTGAFETALDEGDVTTVAVEANGRVFIGRGDAIGPSPFWFSSSAALTRAVDRLLHNTGVSRGDEPIVNAVLPDGARLTAVFPPVSPSGPTVVIERPTKTASLLDLAARQVINSQAASAIASALAARRNIVVSGPRGSGRTTILGALVSAASAADRCLLVERTRELAPTLEHVTTLTAGNDWAKAIDLALRLRPQRLAIGDSNEPGASAFVGALGTGNEGMLYVADGPSPMLALHRIAALAAANSVVTRDDALARIAHTRPFVIHVARLGDGVCRVVSIGEARPDPSGGVRVDEQFTLRIEGVNSAGKIEASLVATTPRGALS